MLFSSISLITAIIAVAKGQDAFPPWHMSKGFRLIINVTDLTKDFLQIHNGEIVSWHVTADTNVVSYWPYRDPRNVYWQVIHGDDSTDPGQQYNGTMMTILGCQTSNNLAVLGRGGDTGRQLISLNLGGASVSHGIQLSVHSNFSYVRPEEASCGKGTFAYCNVTVTNWSRDDDDKIMVLHWIGETMDDNGVLGVHVPDLPCIPLTLIPECDPVPDHTDLPQDSWAGPWLERAARSRCYEIVPYIDWTRHLFNQEEEWASCTQI